VDGARLKGIALLKLPGTALPSSVLKTVRA
jgi:hypothetical protein